MGRSTEPELCETASLLKLTDPTQRTARRPYSTAGRICTAANTNNVNAGKPNTFNTAANICKDDCKAIDPLLSCDAKTCTCQKPKPPSCFFNSLSTALGANNSFNPFGGLACADDCKKFDPTLSCCIACKFFGYSVPRGVSGPQNATAWANVLARCGHVALRRTGMARSISSCVAPRLPQAISRQ